MKISGSVPPESDPNVTDDNEDSSVDTADDEEASAFSRLLDKKRLAEKEETDNRSKGNSKALDQPPTAQPPSTFNLSMKTEALENIRTVAVPSEIQQLVQEIAVVTDAAGWQQVHIDLNSKVLQGLHIVIQRNEGAIAIQFQSSSDEVARLLLRNTASLTEGLTERGLNVADIRVTSTSELSDRKTDRFGSRAPRWQGKGQRGTR